MHVPDLFLKIWCIHEEWMRDPSSCVMGNSVKSLVILYKSKIRFIQVKCSGDAHGPVDGRIRPSMCSNSTRALLSPSGAHLCKQQKMAGPVVEMKC